MALDTEYLLFLAIGMIVLVAALLALPGPRRIERNPSTAYKKGRRAVVVLAVALAVVFGLIMALAGFALPNEEVFSGINMVQVGGISLLAMSMTLVGAHVYIRKQVRLAGQGEEEEVIEVDTLSSYTREPAEVEHWDGPPYPAPRHRPPPGPPPRGPPPRRRPPPDWEGRPPPRRGDGAAPPPVPPRVRGRRPPR